MDNFIPGPWRAQINGSTVSILTVTTDGTYGAAVALLQQVHKPHVIPTAYLIAAAPEMFRYLGQKASEGDPEASRILQIARGGGKPSSNA